MIRRRPWIAAACAALSAVVVGACGSTVQSGSSSGVTATNGLSAPGSTTDSGLVPGGDSALSGPGGVGGGVGGSGAVASGVGTTGASSGVAGGGPAGPSGSTPPVGNLAFPPGITSSKVLVGDIFYDTDQVQALSSGANGVDTTGTWQRWQRAVVDWINGHGGMAGGRKIGLVEHQVNTTSDPSSQGQANCATFTQDHHVYAAVGQGLGEPNTLSCMNKARVPVIAAGVDAGSQRMFQQFPNYFVPGGMEDVATGRAYVDGAYRQGFFGKGVKVGLIAPDVAPYRDQYNLGMLPTLRKHGLAAPLVEWITFTDVEHYGQTLAQIQSSVLKFRSEGITNVMFMDVNGTFAYYFMKNADSQHYYPRYAFSSQTGPGALPLNFSAQVMHDSVGIGWMPQWDVLPGKAITPEQKQCERIMVKAGLTPASDSERELEYGICAQFFFLRSVLSKMSSSYSFDAFVAAAESLGDDRPSSAHGLSNVIGPGKHWGGDVYYDERYYQNCNCFKYGAKHSVTTG